MQFFDLVLGPGFGGAALCQGPVYGYLLSQRAEFDGVSAFYTVFLVSSLLQGHLIFNYCAVCE